MPWLFLVAVIRPLSMSFSFDASGKVCLAAYLTFFFLSFFQISVSLCVVAAHLLTQPAHTPHTKILHSSSTHFMSCFNGWWWLARWQNGEVRHWSVGGHWWGQANEWNSEQQHGRTAFLCCIWNTHHVKAKFIHALPIGWMELRCWINHITLSC